MRHLLLFAILLLHITGFSQTSKIEGKVTDALSGEKLTGISVSVSGNKLFAITNTDGVFVVSVNPGKKISIRLSSIGYKTKEVTDIAVVAGEITHLDIVMESAVKTEEAVIIKSSSRKETVNALISYQKNTAVVAQVISAEAIRRSPDKNTGEVLKRVPGTSVQEGKYLVVRGLADRYNQAMLNGILLSSTEPDRKTFSFDIFPAAVIENIIINKTFLPELPGEWAGGLIQVNTKDIPSKNFLNVQVGTGFNSNVLGKQFYSYKGSNTDFLGFDNGTRALPSGFPTKSSFGALNENEKTAYAAQFNNNWAVNAAAAAPNTSLQIGSGFAGKLFNKKMGGTFAVNYNRSIKRYDFQNSFFSIDNNKATSDFLYNTNKYAKEVQLGAIANFSMQLNSNNKISLKNIFNVNSTNYTSIRTGYEGLSINTNIRAKELAMRNNIFYNSQILGEHNLTALNAKINWFGSFNILDQYVPDQRRSEYIQNETTGLFEARISTGQSQKSGSIFYSNLSDYIYTAGGDIAKSFQLFGNKQTIKTGYFFQVKDRLFDSRPFFVKLYDNNLKTLPEDQLFTAANFAPGKLGLDEFVGKQYRYMANSILNAGFLQFDNLFTKKIRAVWGVRVEDFDQLIGSVKTSDPRHVHTRVTDFLPALNLTYKVNNTKNIRLSGSQTVIRPEFRELTNFAFFDFELNATVLGNRDLQRTKVSNIDLRYEIYPRAGELFTFGVFYKYFDKPIELLFNQSGAGSSNTFNFQNAQSATGFGVEFDMRKKLDFIPALKNFTFTSNLSYIYNRVKFSNQTLNRPMQGQSPYVINAGLQYDLEKLGLNTTLLFNQIGRRVAYVGNDQVPAIWEAPRPLLDLQVAKKIMKEKVEIRLSISDLLNRQANFYHDLDGNGKFTAVDDALAVKKIFGTSYSISFAFKLK